MRAWAESLLARCRELSPGPKLRSRVVGSVAEDLARLLAPLL
jgi:hypothetical protein